MYIHMPLGLEIAELGALALVAVFVVRSLARGAATAGLSTQTTTRLVLSSAVIMVGWAVLGGTLAAQGVFRYDAANPFPALPVAVVAPMIVGALLIATVPPLRAAVNAIPQSDLIGAHTMRVVGVVFLVLMGLRVLPAVFALPAGLGDITTGVFAFVLARAYVKQKPSLRRETLFWNLFGLADFITALTIGFLASTTPFQLIHATPTTDDLTMLPLIMVPIFGVPLLALLHGLSLARLRNQQSSVMIDAFGRVNA